MNKIIENCKYLEDNSKTILQEEFLQESATDNSEQCDFDIPIFRPGDKLGIVTPQFFQKMLVEESGEVTPFARSGYFIDIKNDTECQVDKTPAEVISFDDKTVTARVYFSKHHSRRIFKKMFLDMLEEQQLLYAGAKFYIVTSKEDNNGSKKIIMSIEKYDNGVIASEIKDLYAEIEEAMNEEC